MTKMIKRILTTAATATAAFAFAAAAPAATIDLTTAGSSGTLNGALFQQANPQPTGTGVIDPFVRLQSNGSEQGYNTDDRPTQFDEKTDIHTHSLQLSDVGAVTLSGVTYREFLLDINEPRNATSGLITLDKMQLFLSGSKSNTYPNLGTKVYDLGAGNSVLLNASLTHGSGSGDMFALVPESAFANHPGTDYLYLYSHFTGGAGGFEEWASMGTGGCTPPVTPSVPEPATATLSLAALSMLGLRRPRRNA